MQQTLEIPKELKETLIDLITTCTKEAFNSQNLASKEWFSLKEAANYAGVSFNTLSNFRQLGLKVSEIQGIKRVSRKEIDRFLEEYSF